MDRALVSTALFAFGVALVGSLASAMLARAMFPPEADPSAKAIVRAGGSSLCGPLLIALALSPVGTLWVWYVSLAVVAIEWIGALLIAPAMAEMLQSSMLASWRKLGVAPWFLIGGLLVMALGMAPPVVPFMAGLLGALAGSSPLIYREAYPADLAPLTACELAIAGAIVLLVNQVYP